MLNDRRKVMAFQPAELFGSVGSHRNTKSLLQLKQTGFSIECVVITLLRDSLEMKLIFVPVRCPACLRHSAMSFSHAALRQQLERHDEIEFQCAYDDHRWPARIHDRIQVMRWLQETDATVRSLFDSEQSNTAVITRCGQCPDGDVVSAD